MRGQIHLYIGDGKGKTTAAVGLSLRALGAGKKVAFFQFMKGVESGEFEALKKSYSQGFFHATNWDTSFIITKPNTHQLRMAQELYALLCETLQKGEYDLVVADEILVAHTMGLLSTEEIMALFELKNDLCEFVLTGDTKYPSILEKGDLVTCMTKVKHYYDNGVTARKGIEY